MAKNKIWVVIANCSYAEIYEIVLGRDIHKLYHIDYPDGRKKSGEILTDKPGRSFARKSEARHALGSQVDVHSHELQVFAHQLVGIIHHAHSTQVFEKLALIAPPQFLGELRNLLSDTVKKSIYKEINKDLSSSLTDNDRIDQFCKMLEIKRPPVSSKA